MDIIKRIILFITLSALQALILNNVILFNVALPLLYIYFILIFPPNTPKWTMPLWGFSLGFVADLFTNTPGMSAGATTLTAFIQPYLLMFFTPRDSAENIKPSIKTFGIISFLTYAAILVLIFCITLFSLEVFNTLNWQYTLMSIIGSWVFTMMLIVVIEIVRQ